MEKRSFSFRFIAFVGLLTTGFLFLSACSEPSGGHFGSMDLGDSMGIMGGETVEGSDPLARQVHLMERLTLRKGKKFVGYCTTGLVHKRLLIIAAHCLPGPDEKATLKVHFALPNKKVSTIEVIDWQAHPTADLALMELASDPPASAEELLLPDLDVTYRPSVLDVAGYGDITGEIGKDGKSGILRKTSLDIISYYPDSQRIRLDQSRGKGVCEGDSGGPGFIEHDGVRILIGIASTTRGASKNNLCDLESFFINLPVYMEWIYETAREIQVRSSRPANRL